MTEHRFSEKLNAALEFVEQQRRHGIELVNLDGLPTLHVEPGVTPAEVERWKAVNDSFEKLVACRSEMIYQVRRGKLALNPHPARWLTGPSWTTP